MDPAGESVVYTMSIYILNVNPALSLSCAHFGGGTCVQSDGFVKLKINFVVPQQQKTLV